MKHFLIFFGKSWNILVNFVISILGYMRYTMWNVKYFIVVNWVISLKCKKPFTLIIDINSCTKKVKVADCMQNISTNYEASTLSGESKEAALTQTLSTALFSFLYHLASYESGGEALVSCGIMETLLRIVQWRSLDNSQVYRMFGRNVFIVISVWMIKILISLEF